MSAPSIYDGDGNCVRCLKASVVDDFSICPACRVEISWPDARQRDTGDRILKVAIALMVIGLSMQIIAMMMRVSNGGR